MKTAREVLQAKVALLKRYVDEGVSEGETWPRSIEQFRLWHAPDRGVFKIGSKSTVEKHKDLKIQARALIEILAARAAKRRAKPQRLAMIEERLAALKHENACLINELTRVRHALIEEQERVRAQQDLLERKQNTIAQLQAKLHKIIPLKPEG